MPQNKYIRAAFNVTHFITHQVLRRKPTLAYVGGWLGQQNLGDELLYEAHKQLFKNIDFQHYNGGKQANFYYRYAPKRMGGILGGGTLIGQIDKWLELAKQFEQFNNPLVVLGTGVADPHFWKDGTPLSEWKKVLNKCPIVGVRGPMSANYLSEAGVNNVEVVGDPGLVFARKSATPDYHQGVLALNFGRAHERMWGTAENVRDEMAKLATSAKQAGWQVQWLVVFPGDLEITMEAAQKSNTTEQIIPIYGDHEHYIDLVSKATVFVGMKLHATVLSTCAYTPSIMLEYRKKCRDYMQSIEHDEFVIKTSDFRAESCWERLLDMANNRSKLSEELMRQMAEKKVALIEVCQRAKTHFQN